jgi:site-specific recombinase XerD
MECKYKPVNLDPRAREYVNTIEEPRTRETYLYALKAFSAYRVRGCPTPLAWKAMTADVLKNFDAWLRDEGYSARSRSTYNACVLKFLRYGLDQEWLPENFSLDRALIRKQNQSKKRASYPIPKISDRIGEIISYYDNQPLLDVGGDSSLEKERSRVKRLCVLRARAAVHVMYASAGRVSEIVSLMRKQVQDGRAKEALIVGKGTKERFLFFTPDAQRAIQAYCVEREDEFEPLFIAHGRNRGMRLSRAMLWKIVSDAAHELGFVAHPHDFRHKRASDLLNAGVRLEVIQEILGHSDISTTRKVYAHFDKNAVREIFDRASAGV